MNSNLIYRVPKLYSKQSCKKLINFFDNNVSKATKGRYGDNILVHMSKDEADVLAKISGVKKLPTNPDTGLPEAFILAAAAVASAAVGAYSAYKSGKDQSMQASSQSKLISQQQQEKHQSNLSVFLLKFILAKLPKPKKHFLQNWMVDTVHTHILQEFQNLPLFFPLRN